MPSFSPVLRCLYVTAGLIASLATASTCVAAPLTVGVPEFLDSSVFTQAMLTPYGKAANTSIASVAWSGRIEDLVLRRTVNGQSSKCSLITYTLLRKGIVNTIYFLLRNSNTSITDSKSYEYVIPFLFFWLY